MLQFRCHVFVKESLSSARWRSDGDVNLLYEHKGNENV